MLFLLLGECGSLHVAGLSKNILITFHTATTDPDNSVRAVTGIKIENVPCKQCVY